MERSLEHQAYPGGKPMILDSLSVTKIRFNRQPVHEILIGFIEIDPGVAGYTDASPDPWIDLDQAKLSIPPVLYEFDMRKTSIFECLENPERALQQTSMSLSSPLDS